MSRRIGPRHRRCLALFLGLVAVTGPAAAEETVLGVPSKLEVEGGERVRLGAGTPLRAVPRPSAPVVLVVDADTELEIVERRGAWVRVRYAGRSGWVPAASGPAPLVSDPVAEALPLPAPGAMPPDATAERLSRARAVLGPSGAEHPLGPYTLYTDLAAEGLIARLAEVASQLAEAYRRRYGLALAPRAGEVVVLFQNEEDYRIYERGEEGISGLGLRGHAGGGVAALFAGERARQDLESLLVHELTHLLNRRALGGREAPPWIEEGMANDLAFSRIDAAGRLQLATLGGTSLRIDTPMRSSRGRARTYRTITLAGARASLALVQRRLADHRLTPLPRLLGLGWEQFVDAEERGLHYAQSGFFVRYLLDGEQRSMAAAFRSFLAGFAGGGDGGADELRPALDRGWAELERGFANFLRAQRPYP